MAKRAPRQPPPDSKVWTCGSCGRFLIEPDYVIRDPKGYVHFDQSGRELCKNWNLFFQEERPDVVAAYLIGGDWAVLEMAVQAIRDRVPDPANLPDVIVPRILPNYGIKTRDDDWPDLPPSRPARGRSRDS